MLLRVDMELTRKNFQSFLLVSAVESMYIFPKLHACPLAFSYLPQNNLYLRARYLHRLAYSCLALPCQIKGPLHGNKKTLFFGALIVRWILLIHISDASGLRDNGPFQANKRITRTVNSDQAHNF